VLRAQGQHANAAVAGLQRQQQVGADALLEQAHVLDEAMAVQQVPLDDRPAVEHHGPRSAPDHGDHAAQPPGGLLRVGHHLDVVPGVVDEGAGQAVEGHQGRDFLGESGEHGLQLQARGEGRRDAVEHLGAAARGAQLGIQTRVLETHADLFAQGFEQLQLGGDAAGALVVQREHAQPPLPRPQRRRGQPSAALALHQQGPRFVEGSLGQLPGRIGVRAGQAGLRGGDQLAVGPDQERMSTREAQGLNDVAQGRAQEAVFVPFDAEIVRQGHQGTDRAVLGDQVQWCSRRIRRAHVLQR
jgi:hypothetical protein